jgi:hypothetical protein
LNTTSNGFQSIQNFQNNLDSGSSFFANNPNILSLRNHRLNPTVPLVNLNKSGNGPIIIGLDSQAQRHPQNNKYIVRQGVNYINGFGGGSILRPSIVNSQNISNSTV